MEYIDLLNKLRLELADDNFYELSFSDANLIVAKVENKNLTGSIKDRAVLQMMIECCKEGLINPNTVFIEATSGNTGISIAYISYLLGLKSLIIMPSSMSKQRRDMIKKYHGDLLLVDGGMKECEDKLKDLMSLNDNFINLSQFENANNVLGHYLTTGPEILESKYDFDYIVAGIGTGGTISGIGKYLRECGCQAKIIGVEPMESALLHGKQAGPHDIQGIGANFIPKILDTDVIDEIIDVKSEDAIQLREEIYHKEKLYVGISSGAALKGALEIDKRVKGKKICVIFPDNGDRYDEIR